MEAKEKEKRKEATAKELVVAPGVGEWVELVDEYGRTYYFNPETYAPRRGRRKRGGGSRGRGEGVRDTCGWFIAVTCSVWVRLRSVVIGFFWERTSWAISVYCATPGSTVDTCTSSVHRSCGDFTHFLREGGPRILRSFFVVMVGLFLRAPRIWHWLFEVFQFLREGEPGS